MKQDEPEQDTAAELPPSDEGPAYSEDGVDLTLIRWMLSLTPAERLRALQDHLESLLRIRNDLAEP